MGCCVLALCPLWSLPCRRPFCLANKHTSRHIYHPHTQVGNVFGHVCLSVCVAVCLCVCLSVCPSVQAITFEPLHIDTSFLVCRYIFTISRSSLSIKVIGHWSRSYEKNDNFTYSNMLILCICLQVISEVKVTHQDEDHIKVKVKISTSFPILCQILLISTHHSSVCGYKSLIRSSSYIKVKVILRSK